MIGCTPAARAAAKNLIAPKRFEASVIASAGMPSAAAAATASSTRAMPSTIEYSVCRRRWTKRGAVIGRSGGVLPILPAAAGEEVLQEGAALLAQDASFEEPVVVPVRDGRKVDDAAARAGLRVPRAENDAGEPRVDHGAHAHGAGLERHVELAARKAVIAQRRGRLAQRHDLGERGGVGGRDGPVVAAA